MATCARCGSEIEEGAFLCERCREEEGAPVATSGKRPSDLERRANRWPAWMPKPSPVQYHATVAVTIVVVLLGLALFAFLSHRGVGPFKARAEHWESRPPASLVVNVSVRNDGSKTARANCRIVALVGQTAEAGESVLTDPIDPEKTLRFEHVLHGVDAPPTNVVVNCS